MDKLHRLASGEGVNEIENGYEEEEIDFPGDFAKATEVVAKEGLREGLAHGKELDMQQVSWAGSRLPNDQNKNSKYTFRSVDQTCIAPNIPFCPGLQRRVPRRHRDWSRHWRRQGSRRK